MKGLNMKFVAFRISDMRLIIVLCAASTLLGCRPPNDNLIVPGKRVGNVDLRYTRFQEVSDQEGRVLNKYEQLGLDFSSDGYSKISCIDVFKNTYKTKEGLGVGDTKERVISVYGTPEVVDIPLMAGNVQKGLLAKGALHYPGITWLIDKDGKVWMVDVSRK
jgi:hypothetical protein